jgi:hypothetical protein
VALVVKSWKVTSHPAPGEPNVAIVARDSGLMSFVLSLVGIDATATLQISSRHVFYEKGSLSGFERRFVPLEHVAHTFYGRIKPWKKTGFFIALSVGLGGSLGGALGMLLALVGVALSLLYYFLNRTLTIGVTDVSGKETGLSFGRSLLEGQEIDEKAAENVMRIVEHLIKPTADAPLGDMSLGSTSGSGAMASAAPQNLAELGRNLGLASRSAPQSAAAATAAPTAAATAAKSSGCPKCGTAVPADEVFCGGCGHKLR